MASEYDKIETFKDLYISVKAHGMLTDIEAVCRAQDIIGHSTEAELLNILDKDRMNFYLILSVCWDRERVFDFWNKHSNPDRQRMNEAIKENGNLREELKKADAETKLYKECSETWKKSYLEDHTARVNAERELKAAQEEIQRLKAMCFDLMTKETA